MVLAVDMMRSGYFPKELPPVFSTSQFADFARSWVPTGVTKWTEATTYNLVRSGGLRRPLLIPNPDSFWAIAKECARSWCEISTICADSTFSASKPVLGRDESQRALTADLPNRKRWIRRMELMSSSRFVVRTDVSQFYPSVYTHSIPWALVGKSVAKANRRNGTPSSGDALDTAFRNAQLGQTIGIPIGPDSSFLISELLLCSIDLRISAKFPGLSGLRYFDDFEVFCKSRTEAEEILLAIEVLLGEFGLRINPTKTSIQEAPLHLEADWINELERFRFRSGDRQLSNDIGTFFELATSLSQKFPQASVFSYAMQVARRQEDLGELSWKVLQFASLQALLGEPACIRHVYVVWRSALRAGVQVRKDLLAAALNNLVRFHAPLLHSAEVTWALFFMARFEIQLLHPQAVADSLDTASCLLLRLLIDRGLSATPDFANFNSAVEEADVLTGPNWLLAYQSAISGWGTTAIVAGDINFSALLNASVSFLDDTRARALVPRAIAPCGSTVPNLATAVISPPLEPDEIDSSLTQNDEDVELDQLDFWDDGY